MVLTLSAPKMYFPGRNSNQPHVKPREESIVMDLILTEASHG